MTHDLFGHKRQLVHEMNVLVLTRNLLLSDKCIKIAAKHFYISSVCRSPLCLSFCLDVWSVILWSEGHFSDKGRTLFYSCWLNPLDSMLNQK